MKQPKLKPVQVRIEVLNGPEGPSLYIGDNSSAHRLAGPKAWGGGRTVFSFVVSAAEVIKELESYVQQGDQHGN